MRLKHVKGASEQIESSDYIIKETNIKKKDLFNNDNPLFKADWLKNIKLYFVIIIIFVSIIFYNNEV